MQELFPNSNFVPPKRGTGLRLVISEAPGSEEELRGEPLVGGSGRWYDSMARKARVPRASVTITNCLSCRPPKNVFPTSSDARSYISLADAKEAVEQCYQNHVVPVLKSRPWTRIDLLGERPLRIVAKKNGGIFKHRGSPMPIPELGEKNIAIPTLHPAYVMRDQTYVPVVVNDFKKGLIEPPENYNIKPSLDDVRAFDAKEFCFDIETNRFTNEILMVGLSDKPFHAICVPFRGAYIPELKRIFRNATSLVGHNSIQFDLPILQKSGVQHREAILWDTMLMQHLLQPDLPHDLEFVGSLFSNKPAWKGEKESLETYCCRDTDVTRQCWTQLKAMLKVEKLEDLYHLVQVPLAMLCHLMQTTGFKVDPSRITEVRKRIEKEMHTEEAYLTEELRTYDKPINKRQLAPPGTKSEKTGRPLKYVMVPSTKKVVPWRSAKPVEKYLYYTLTLPVQHHVKTERVTTDKMAIDKLYRLVRRDKHRADSTARSILAIKKLRRMDEIQTTFCKEQMTHVKRMHAHFNVHGTASGRFSSSKPNLQNIPEAARVIYVPSHPDWVIVDVDYSQIENRLTAHFANDTARLTRFLVDPNFSEHKYAASKFFDIPYDEVEKDNDKDAPYGKSKRIVHGTNYGMGAQKISRLYDMDFKEVKGLLARWKKEIEPSIRWQEVCANQAKYNGHLTTPFGRKRWFWTTAYYTESLSFLPQSTAADIIFRAMLALMYERIGWDVEKIGRIVRVWEPLPQPARLLLQVHDSLVFECPKSQVDDVVDVVRRVMEQPFPELGGMNIPIGVAVGPSWGEVEAYVT